MKLHRKIKHNEKVCHAHDLGSYAQGHIKIITVRLSIRPLQIVSQQYLINYWSKFDETSQKDKA